MKIITAIILLIALLAQLGGRYLVMLHYKINKNYIAVTLCVNRDKPRSVCHGKCYLKKQLAKAAKEEGIPNNNTRDDRNEILFLSESKKIAIYYVEEINKSYLNSQQSHTPPNGPGSVFHPPQAG